MFQVLNIVNTLNLYYQKLENMIFLFYNKIKKYIDFILILRYQNFHKFIILDQ
jgi:hypothetical protein